MKGYLKTNFGNSNKIKMKISIEGNLASGKSTLVMKLQATTRIPTFLEPVDTWNFLGDFYRDPQRWGFTFNLEVLISMSRWAKNEYLSIYERSPMSCRRVFTELHVEEGIMTFNELAIFDRIYKEFAWNQDVIIYVKTDPAICYERMRQRNRICEQDVSLKYLEAIHQKHVEMMEYIERVHHDIRVFVVDGNRDAEEVYKNVLQIINGL